MPIVQTLPGPYETDRSADLIGPLTRSVLMPVIRRTLHVSLSEADTTAANQDALELLGDIQVILLSTLSDPAHDDRTIENIDAYAATVASNTCYHYLRSKSPVRTQHYNKLRYLLTHDDRFKAWRDSDGQWMCSMSESGKDAPGDVSKTTDERGTFVNLIISLLVTAEGPVAMGDVVDKVMRALGVRERIRVTAPHGETDGDPIQQIADTGPKAQETLEMAEGIRHIWSELIKLPLRHRQALLLNLKDRDGGLILTLPMSGSVRIGEIASALEMTPKGLAEIWNSLPWDDLRIAEHMQISRQQVINLRQAARAKLLRAIATKDKK